MVFHKQVLNDCKLKSTWSFSMSDPITTLSSSINERVDTSPMWTCLNCDDDISTTLALADSKVILWRPPSEGWVGRSVEGWPGKVALSQRAREMKVLRWGRSAKVASPSTLYFGKKKENKYKYISSQKYVTLKSDTSCYSYMWCENCLWHIRYHQVGNINTLV